MSMACCITAVIRCAEPERFETNREEEDGAGGGITMMWLRPSLPEDPPKAEPQCEDVDTYLIVVLLVDPGID